MQAGAEGDAVDAGIERGAQAHAQRLARRVHGELFHAVEEDHAIAALGLHGAAHVVARGLLQNGDVEVHGRFVAARDVALYFLSFALMKLVSKCRSETACTRASEM